MRSLQPVHLPDPCSVTAHGADRQPWICPGFWVLVYSATIPMMPVFNPSDTPAAVHGSGCPTGKQLQRLLLMLCRSCFTAVGIVKLGKE